MHDDDLDPILRCLERVRRRREVLGLLFRFLYFKADYWSVDHWPYHWGVRLIRNDGRVRSIGNACGFGCVDDPKERNLKDGPRRRLVKSGGRIFHCAYIKDPTVLIRKKRYQASRYPEVIPDGTAAPGPLGLEVLDLRYPEGVQGDASVCDGRAHLARRQAQAQEEPLAELALLQGGLRPWL